MKYGLIALVALTLISCTKINQYRAEEGLLSPAEIIASGSLLASDESDANKGILDFEQQLLDDDPLLTQEMKDFVDYFAPPGMNHFARIQGLKKGIVSGGGLGLKYVANANYSASDAFKYQQANCLSFSLMFYAMAQRAQLPATFNEVDVPPSWDMDQGGVMITYMHMNTIITAGPIRQVVDVNLENFNIDYPQRIISISEALAHYYNNKAVEAMLNEQPLKAFAAFKVAIKHNPKGAYIWGNLGTLYKSKGRQLLARSAYYHALSLNGFDSLIASNLARVEFILGNQQQANALNQQVERFRNNNPYYLYALAKRNVSEGRSAEAFMLVSKAIALEPNDHRFYHLSAQINGQLGKTTSVLKDLEMATESAQKFQDKEMYRGKYNLVRAR